jgi:hypothetical protein
VRSSDGSPDAANGHPGHAPFPADWGKASPRACINGGRGTLGTSSQVASL